MAIQADFGIPNTDTLSIAIIAASLYIAEATPPGQRDTFETKCKRVIDASEILWKISTGDPDEARAMLKKITGG